MRNLGFRAKISRFARNDSHESARNGSRVIEFVSASETSWTGPRVIVCSTRAWQARLTRQSQFIGIGDLTKIGVIILVENAVTRYEEENAINLGRCPFKTREAPCGGAGSWEKSMLHISPEWKEAYPGSLFGLLAMSRVSNPASHAGLAKVKEELQADLKALFKNRSDLRALEPIKAYQAYYKKFGNTYHVLQQLESVLFKGKSIASVSALVECMFIEELRNMLLTAGHDLAAIEMPLTLDIAKEGDRYTRINGKDQEAKPGDMILRDAAGIISTVIYGPDSRTRITSSTRTVLFTVYGAPGVGKQNVRQHLEGIATNVKIVAPEAAIDSLEVYSAT